MSTAMVSSVNPQDEAAEAVARLLRAIGEDPEREGLLRTPERPSPRRSLS